VRLTGEGQQLALVLNLADEQAQVDVPMPSASVVAGGGTVAPQGVIVPPHGFTVLGST
jgi:hypothetical protein